MDINNANDNDTIDLKKLFSFVYHLCLQVFYNYYTMRQT